MGTFGRQILSTTGRPLQISADGRPEWKAGGITLDWSLIAAVSAETTLADGTVVANGDKYLRYGAVLGKITSGGQYAPSVLGPTTAAYAQGETTITVSAATAAELVARQGASGTFKLYGGTTSGATPRTSTITYSAVDTSTGDITVTAIGASDVQTITLQAGADGGTFKVKYDEEITAALAYNVSTADMQTALRALHADLAATVVTGTAGESYVITTAGVSIEDIQIAEDMILDGAVLEPATIIHTTVGVVGAFESGSLVMPTDGSELFTKGETFILNESVVYSEPGSDHPAVLDGGLVFNARIKDTGDLLQGLLDTALPRLKLLRETN